MPHNATVILASDYHEPAQGSAANERFAAGHH
jgi:hypothetical protein